MSKFTAAVAANLAGCESYSVGACPGCADCGLDGIDDGTIDDGTREQAFDEANEGHFSMMPCDSCGSILGGDRYPAHWIYNGVVQHDYICVDCLMYHANGEEPV